MLSQIDLNGICYKVLARHTGLRVARRGLEVWFAGHDELLRLVASFVEIEFVYPHQVSRSILSIFLSLAVLVPFSPKLYLIQHRQSNLMSI